MTNTIKKILLIDFDEKQQKDFEQILSDFEIINIPFSDDFEKDIRSNSPASLILNTKTCHREEGCINVLNSISGEMKIPVFYIANTFKNDEFLDMIQKGACNIITAPVLKKNFLQRLETFSSCYSDCSSEYTDSLQIKVLHKGVPRDLEINPKNLNILINSLLCNLENQVEFSKANLKIKNSLIREKEKNGNLTEEEIETEKLLWDAYENDHFALFYQPVISLTSDKLFGFEALIRINHPERGIINPGEFIDVAEKSEIIYPLGLWIVETACKQISEWKEKFILDTHLKINTNLSSRQFLHEGLAEDILKITDRYNIKHQDMGFELTESTFMEDMEKANLALLQLKSKDFHIYMDDFGTGYSSLSYLTHFPMNILKIDQSFVKWMHIDEQSETIVKSIISLAHNLGLKVVAEGTDDEEHIEILKTFNCDYAQGYFYAKPMPPGEAEDYILKHFALKQAM